MSKPSVPAIAASLAMAGFGMVISGVFVLFGLGWALLAGAVPLLIAAGILFRGLARV